MGDISAEPSMEDILSSIKRIIAEEGDATHLRQRRPQRPALPPTQPIEDEADEDDHPDAVLELSDPMPASQPEPAGRSDSSEPSSPPAEPILSRETMAASRGSLEALSRLLTKPEPGSDGTLEGLVRELLRPMLREWLDANLPDLVESLVAKEIEKITGQAG